MWDFLTKNLKVIKIKTFTFFENIDDNSVLSKGLLVNIHLTP